MQCSCPILRNAHSSHNCKLKVFFVFPTATSRIKCRAKLKIFHFHLWNKKKEKRKKEKNHHKLIKKVQSDTTPKRTNAMVVYPCKMIARLVYRMNACFQRMFGRYELCTRPCLHTEALRDRCGLEAKGNIETNRWRSEK